MVCHAHPDILLPLLLQARHVMHPRPQDLHLTSPSEAPRPQRSSFRLPAGPRLSNETINISDDMVPVPVSVAVARNRCRAQLSVPALLVLVGGIWVPLPGAQASLHVLHRRMQHASASQLALPAGMHARLPCMTHMPPPAGCHLPSGSAAAMTWLALIRCDQQHDLLHPDSDRTLP
jgi:hypothetical protein